MSVEKISRPVDAAETSDPRSRLMRYWPSAARALLAALLSIWAAGFALAQNTNSGDIRGSVTDATGALVPGVTVTIVNTNTGVAKELVTNAAGLYDAVSSSFATPV